MHHIERTELPDWNQCTANKASTGERCRAYAISGGTVCKFHGGKAPAVRAMAKRRLELTKDRIMRELQNAINVDPAKFFDPEGHFLPIHEIPEDIRRAISALEWETQTTGKGKSLQIKTRITKIKLIDKLGAITLTARIFNMLKDNNQAFGEGTGDREVKIVFVRPGEQKASNAVIDHTPLPAQIEESDWAEQ